MKIHIFDFCFSTNQCYNKVTVHVHPPPYSNGLGPLQILDKSIKSHFDFSFKSLTSFKICLRTDSLQRVTFLHKGSSKDILS